MKEIYEDLLGLEALAEAWIRNRNIHNHYAREIHLKLFLAINHLKDLHPPVTPTNFKLEWNRDVLVLVKESEDVAEMFTKHDMIKAIKTKLAELQKEFHKLTPRRTLFNSRADYKINRINILLQECLHIFDIY